MPTGGVKIKHKNPRKLGSILSKFKKSPDVELAVGFPGNLVGGIRYPVKKEFGRIVKGVIGERVVDVAAANEFGRAGPPSAPARPFMKQSSKDVKAFLHNKYKKKNFKKSSGGIDNKEARKFMVQYAPEIEAIYFLRIQNLTEPPNSPVTIAIKGSSNPLIDTGLMGQTLTYDIRTRKK